MSLFGWRGSKSPARKSPPHIRLQLEVLEDRTVPTVFNVAAGDVATLIADMNVANTLGGSNTINLAAGTYDLTAVNNNMYGPNGLPAITSNLTINGNGAVIQRDPSLGLNDPFRLFYVSDAQGTTSPVGDLTLENVTLQDGLAQGGNSGTGGGGLGAGGAIFNQGTLDLNSVTLTQNTALGGSDSLTSVGGGGGIGQNARGDDGGGFGGVIAASLPSPFGLGGTSSSSGVGGAGGVGGGGGDSTATPASGVSANGGAGGFGGGGGSGTDLGGAGGFGGGGGSSGGSGAGGAGGFGAGQGSDNGGGGGAGLGGAIFNDGGTATLVNSTLTTNLAEGGTGGSNAADGDGYGGAIFNLNGTVNLTSSTLASNSVEGKASSGGAVYNLAQGTTAAQSGQALVNLTDSILANSVGGNDLVDDQNNSTTASAVVNATTPNIVTAMSTINGATTNGTPSTANPLLGPLDNNGGPTPTMAPLSNSPALGIGVGGGTLPTTDQRGDSRGSVIDLGAVQETTSPAPVTTLTLSTSAANVLAGQPVTLTATVTTSAYGAEAPTGSVLFVDTTTNTTLGSIALSVVNGQAQATLTPTLNLGTHAITATYQSASSTTPTTTSSSSTTATTASPSASLSVLVGSSDQLWLQQIYETLLGRAVDPTGLAYWSTVMAQGTSRGEVAYLLQQTLEYQTDQISAAFQTLLNRPVDAASLTYYLGLMQSGDSIQQIDSMIVGSTEFYQENGDSPTGFLNAIYEDFLHRAIDSASLQTGAQAIADGQTLAQVALGVLSSTEYFTDLVQNDYQTYLNRAADAGSLNAFVTYLSVGGSNTAVVATLLGSPEYFSS